MKNAQSEVFKLLVWAVADSGAPHVWGGGTSMQKVKYKYINIEEMGRWGGTLEALGPCFF